MFQGKRGRYFLGNNNCAGSTQAPVSRSQLKMFWQRMYNKCFYSVPRFNYIHFMAKLFYAALPSDKTHLALESREPLKLWLFCCCVASLIK